MVTQFHTLLHFVTLFTTILSPTASAAASTRKPGVSKSHLLSIYTHIHMYTNTMQSIAAGPVCYCHFKPPCLWASALSN